MTVTLNTSLQNLQADSWGTDLDSGFIDIYTGSQPAANTAPTGTLLVSIALNADAYAAAVAGVATSSAISGVAVADGTAGYAQQRNAANTRWMYGSVSETGDGGTVQLETLAIEIGQTVTLALSTITQPASA